MGDEAEVMAGFFIVGLFTVLDNTYPKKEHHHQSYYP
jgi:hypothetical protein